MDGLKMLQSGIDIAIPTSPKGVDSPLICLNPSFESVESDFGIKTLNKVGSNRSIDSFPKINKNNRHRRSCVVLIGNEFWHHK
jgi:hypothetical protein